MDLNRHEYSLHAQLNATEKDQSILPDRVYSSYLSSKLVAWEAQDA